jgi:REP element-mobilizing transposase RayT
MANTYTQIYIQIIFSVKNRESFIPKTKKEELHKYITGIVENKKCKMLSINSVPDHIHIFIGLHPSISISELVKSIKIASNDKINDDKWIRSKFEWQGGFGAFSYSKSQIDTVCKYIQDQEEHHKHQSFREEYIQFLEKFGIEYNPKYVFDIE